MPTNTHRNLNFIFFVLFFCQILLIYTSYGTQNFSKLKCKYENFKACEKCDKNSKIFYEIKNKKICPRCTLGYLSYYFAGETINEIEFYSTDIVFHSITDAYGCKTKNKITWNFINNLVQDKINEEKLILQKRKAANQSFDLFLIVNEILTKLKQIPLKKSKCSKCCNPSFHLIKLGCAKKFMCNLCFDEFHIGKTNCEICKTRCEMKVFWFGNIRPQKKPFGNWIPRPGYGTKTVNLVTHGMLAFLILSLSESMSTYDTLMFAIAETSHFCCVWAIMEGTFMADDAYSTRNIPEDIQENVNLILKEFVKIIVVWMNILIAGLYSGDFFTASSGFFTTITLPTISYIFCELRKRIYSYVGEQKRYEFL